MRRRGRVAIVGYGIAGIAAAIELRRLGLDITHFERRQTPGARGAGMLLHPPAQRALERLGVVATARRLGAPVDRIRARNLAGRKILSLDYRAWADGQAALGIRRAHLHRVLAHCDEGRARLRCGVEVRELCPRDGRLLDASGRLHGPFELIVVADGAHSGLRHAFESDPRRQRLAETAALVGVLPAPVTFVDDALHQFYDGGQHVSTWPVAAHEIAFAVSLSRTDAQRIHKSDEWKARVIELCPELARALTNGGDTADVHVFTYRHVTCRRWACARAVLIGDAAHAMSPLLGAGAHFAMDDAVHLADALASRDDVPLALSRFERRRSRAIRRYQRASRWLTPLFMSEHRLLALCRDQLFSRFANQSLAQRLLRDVLV